MRHHAALSNAMPRRALPLVLTVLLTPLCLTVSSAQAQTALPYNHSTFLNGFASSPRMWMAHYSALNGDSTPQYLNRSIVLRTIGLFYVDTAKRYNAHVQDLYTFLQPNEQHVLIGHSLGAMVARGVYNDSVARRSNISAIVALAAPHQGTRLANNAETAKEFVNDVQRRVNDAKPYARFVDAVAFVLFGQVLSGIQPLFDGIAYAILVWPTTTVDVTAFDQLAVMKALPDLRTDAAAVTHLNSVSADNAIQRVNITGNIPIRDAAIRLEYSAKQDDAHFNQGVSAKRTGLVAFNLCKYAGYATIVLSPAARKCAYAVKVLERLDDQWAGFVNGRANTCFVIICGINAGRTVPFDGAVSNELQHWPGTAPSYEANVTGADHMNIYALPNGLNATIDGMKRIGMQQQAPLTASIGGPTILSGTNIGTWTAGVSGGTLPYRYQWSGILSGTSISISGRGYGTLYLDAWDSNGGHVTTSIQVTQTSGCGFKIYC